MQRLIVTGWFLWCIVGAQVKFPDATNSDNQEEEAVSENINNRAIDANDNAEDKTSNDNSGVIFPGQDKKEDKMADRIRNNAPNPPGVNNKVKENAVDPHGVKWPGADKDKVVVSEKTEPRPNDNASGVKFPVTNKHYGMTGTQSCNAGQDCVPHIQCENGQIKTDGGGILSDRGRTPTSNCASSKHHGEITICCGIPGWVAPTPTVVECAYNQKCVDPNLCDENGNIITDGSNGLLSNRISNRQKCSLIGDVYRTSTSSGYGVCCTPPITATTPSPWVVAPECGISSPTPEDFVNVRIASPAGNEAYFGQFPWQAAVFFSNYTFQCGGTIIGDRWVLTAAHCIYGSSPHELKIRVGEWRVNTFEEPLNYEDVDVKAVKIHEHYNPENSQNNIAIIELAKPLVWQYHINRICLPCEGQEFWGKRCLGSGWGKDAFTGNFADILKLVDLPIVDDMQCQKLLRKTKVGEYFLVHDSFICAGGENNKDACKGDGGGPLACQNPDGRYVVAGITNTGVDCGKKDVPGLYADVVHFLQWIRSTIGGSYQSECHGTPKPPNHQPEYHPATQAPHHQPPHYQQGNGGNKEDVHQQVDGKDYHFSWKKDGLKKFSHPQAVDYCKFLPGDWHIIAIESRTENDYVSNIIKTTPVEYIWTDGVRTKSTQIWSWPNGGPFSPLAWSSTGAYQQHQPDNHNASGEDCLAILNNAYNDGVRWHDARCSLPKFTICERVSRPGW